MVTANETIDIPFSDNGIISEANLVSECVDGIEPQTSESDISSVISGTDELSDRLNLVCGRKRVQIPLRQKILNFIGLSFS